MRHHPLGYHRPDVVTLRGYGRRGMGEIQLFATPDPMVRPPEEPVTLLYPPGYTGGLSLWMAKRPVAWTLGLFAAGWAGGYLTWLAIGKKRG
jgi:hypothetical protein